MLRTFFLVLYLPGNQFLTDSTSELAYYRESSDQREYQVICEHQTETAQPFNLAEITE
jgi:hypothetical protein